MKIKIIMLLAGILILLNFNAYASSVNVPSEQMQRLENSAKRIQSENNYYPDISISRMINTYKETKSIGITFNDFKDSLVKFIFREVYANLKIFLMLIAVGILCSMIQNIRDSFQSTHIATIGYYVCYIAMMVLVIEGLSNSIEVGRQTINNMIEFTNALMPPLLILIASVGGFASAATLDPIILFMIKAISNIIRDFVLPMTILVMAVSFVNNLSKNIKISGVRDLLFDICKWSLGIIVTIFIGFITIRSSTSATLDQVTLKTTKYAVDNFIPVIGKALSDAIATVAGYSLLLKNAISVAGLVVMLFICIFPLLKLIILSLTFKLVGAILEPIVDSSIISDLGNAGKVLTLVFSSVLAVAVMFFILITIVISTGRLVMMG